MQMSENTKQLIREELQADTQFNFKTEGKFLRKGICPKCGEKTVYVSLDLPGRVACDHANKCEYSEKTTERYKHIFENLSEKYPSTDTDPNRTARHYLSDNRGFDSKHTDGIFTQEYKKLSSGEAGATIRVKIDDQCFWERLIDNKSIGKNDGQAKNRIIGSFKSKCWQHPKLKVQKNDAIWVTEAIFKSLALMHVGCKSIACLSAGNRPRDFFNAHKGKGITWVIALDNDKAGIKYAKKHAQYLDSIHEKYLFAFTRTKTADWDDEFRNDLLDAKYLDDSIWRGFYEMADSVQRKAFFYFCQTKNPYFIVNFKKGMYRCEVDKEKIQSEYDGDSFYPGDSGWFAEKYKKNSLFAAFNSFAAVTEFATCLPTFRYIEEDGVNPESLFNFMIEHHNGNPNKEVTLAGEDTISHSSLNNAFARLSRGGRFQCSRADFKILHDRWFKHQSTFVRTINHIGYEPDSKMYIFKDYAIHNGREIKIDNLNFFDNGTEKIKSTLTQVNIKKHDKLNLDWIIAYKKCSSQNGVALLAWWIGSLFAVQIRKKYGKWPFFEYSGERGAGKSEQISFLWKCMGRTEGESGDYEGFDPSSDTAVAAYDQMGQVGNLPTVLLEGDHNPANDNKVKTNNRKLNFESLKRAFNGGAIRSRGTKNRSLNTEVSMFLSTILISQNATVEGSKALLSRIIHCHATTKHFSEAGEKQSRRLQELTVKDIGAFLPYCLKKEAALLAKFDSLYTKLHEEFSEYRETIESRLRETHAMISAWGYLLCDIFPGFNLDDAEILKKHLVERMFDRQDRLVSDNPLVMQFWDQYEYINYRREKISNVETTIQILNHSNDSKLIAINFADFQSKANKYGLDRLPLSILKPLLKNNTVNPFVKVASVRSSRTKEVLRCWVFNNNMKRETDE